MVSSEEEGSESVVRRARPRGRRYIGYIYYLEVDRNEGIADKFTRSRACQYTFFAHQPPRDSTITADASGFLFGFWGNVCEHRMVCRVC